MNLCEIALHYNDTYLKKTKVQANLTNILHTNLVIG